MTPDDEDCLLNLRARNQNAHVLSHNEEQGLRRTEIPFPSLKINAVAPEMDAFEGGGKKCRMLNDE
jgi:hypothetical protein